MELRITNEKSDGLFSERVWKRGLTVCESAPYQRETAMGRHFVRQMYPMKGSAPFFQHVLRPTSF